MTDLTPYRDSGAGHRNIDTSISGAAFIQDKLPRLQSLVFNAVSAAGERGLTADEIADHLGWERHRVRPRTSELRNARRIIDSGARRDGACGIAQIVWVTPEHEDAAVPGRSSEGQSASCSEVHHG